MSENLKRHRPDIKVLGEGKAIAFMPEDPMGVWCHIQEVRDLLDVKDNEIAELKAKLEKKEDERKNDVDAVLEGCRKKQEEVDALKAKLDKAIAERDGNQVCIDALKQKLENVQNSMYCDVVDVKDNEIEELKRKLTENTMQYEEIVRNLVAENRELKESNTRLAIKNKILQQSHDATTQQLQELLDEFNKNIDETESTQKTEKAP